MTREDLRLLVMLVMAMGLFDYELGKFLLEACEEEAEKE